MIQYYLDLKNQVAELTAQELAHGQIQKIYSTAYFISLAIRVPGKTWHLYLGRGGGKEGVWLSSKAPPSALRRRDNFLEYFRRHLSSCAFLGAEVDEADRILSLNYQKFGKLQSLLLFWKGRSLYFAHHFQDSPEAPFKVLLSWLGKSFTPPEAIPNLFTLFDDVGRNGTMDHTLSGGEVPAIEDLLEDELKASALSSSPHQQGFLDRKRVNIEEDLRRAKQWQRLQTLLDQQVDLDDLYQLEVGEQKVKFPGDLNPYERRNLVFQKIKKLKRGEEILTKRLAQTLDQISGNTVSVTQESTVPIVKPVWGREAAKEVTQSEKVEQKDDYKIFKRQGFQLGLGVSARGNDQLRSKWASKEDWWIHLDGLKSAHVVVKPLNDSPLSSDMLGQGASLLAIHSDFKDDWIPVIYTQVKNLKGVPGAPGMVRYKKEKRLKCMRVELNETNEEQD